MDMGQQQIHGGFQGQTQMVYNPQAGQQGYNQPQPMMDNPQFQKGIGNYPGQPPIGQQQPRAKHVQPVEQSLNYPMKSGPGSQPHSAAKQPKHYDNQLKTGGFARKDDFDQGGFGADQWPQEEAYQGNVGKPNVNNPPSQYYGKSKPEYQKGGYGGKGGVQQGCYQDSYGGYDPQQAGYYESGDQDYQPVQGGYSKQQQQYGGVHGTETAYAGYDAKKQEKKKLPPATDTTKKNYAKASGANVGVTAPALSQKSQQQVNPKSKKSQPPTFEEMNEAAMQGNRPGIVAMTQVSGDQTTSWLQSAASPNEKFIDDTVENINRKPGFNRLKKKYNVRAKKLEEYKVRISSQADDGQAPAGHDSQQRKSSDSSSKKNSDGGEQQAGDASKARNLDPKMKPHLDFGLEFDENDSEQPEYGNASESGNQGDYYDMNDMHNEEQEFLSDDDGEEENSSGNYERAEIVIPQAKKFQDAPKMMSQDTKPVPVPLADVAKESKKGSDKVKAKSIVAKVADTEKKEKTKVMTIEAKENTSDQKQANVDDILKATVSADKAEVKVELEADTKKKDKLVSLVIKEKEIPDIQKETNDDAKVDSLIAKEVPETKKEHSNTENESKQLPPKATEPPQTEKSPEPKAEQKAEKPVEKETEEPAEEKATEEHAENPTEKPAEKQAEEPSA